MKDLIEENPIIKFLFFVLADVIFIVLSVWLSFFIRFEGEIPVGYYLLVERLSILAVVFIIPIFYFQKLYSFSWSYVSVNEALSLFKATTIAFFFWTIAIYISKYFPFFQNFPRSTIFISYILVFILCGAIRFSKRIYLNIRSRGGKANKERTLIVGAGDAGEQILRNISSSKISPYFPVGFVDDSPMKRSLKIHGIKVLGKIQDIPYIVKNHQIKQLIIAIPSAGDALIKRAVELGRQAGLYKIKIIPSVFAFIRGQLSLKSLKDVYVSNLLGREPVLLDKSQIENFIRGKRVLITGAAGSIGSELSRQVANFSPSLLALLDQDETGIFNIEGEIKKNFSGLNIKSLISDIKDEVKIRNVFSDLKPQIVFHAAAYKHVPLMQVHPDQAVKNNIFGTQILANASLTENIEKFIFISTDKAVNPTSVMGATKRIGEMICQACNQKNKTKFISVRFGNVLDSRGSVIPIFREQIKRRDNVTVTHPEMKRYFMLTSEACLLVMQAGAMGQGGEVFVLDMGKPIKILDLAKEMIKQSGYKVDKDIAIVFTGIRPGEKLFEEILTSEEGTIVTQNQKIFMAKMSNVNFSDMERDLNRLKELINEVNAKEIIDNLKNITPYYK